VATEALTRAWSRAATPAHSPTTWADRAPFAAAIVFSAAFIARGATVIDGRLWFTLFDDAMVSMRYAHNLAAGHGLVWNPGEPGVQGYTNFLWTLWAAALQWAGVPPSLLGLAISVTGLVLLVANLVVIRAICRRLAPGDERVARTALWCTALCYPLVYWTLRGMEVGLVALLLSTGALLVLRARDAERPPWELMAIAALGVLTRADVAVPLAVVIAFGVVATPATRRRAAALALGATPVLVLAAHAALSWRWYGELLPNTYSLKMTGVAPFERLERGLWAAAILVVAQLALPAALAVRYLWATRRHDRPPVGLLVAVPLACLAYSTYVGGDAWEWMLHANRYVAPTLPLLMVVAALGLRHLADGPVGERERSLRAGLAMLLTGAAALLLAPFPAAVEAMQLEVGLPAAAAPLFGAVAVALLAMAWRRGRRPGRVAGRERQVFLVGGAVVLLAAMNLQPLQQWAHSNAAHVRDDAAMTALGAALHDATPPGTRIAVVWAGSVVFAADRPAIDLLGKNDRHIAHGRPQDVPFHPGHTKWDYDMSIGRLHPDVVVGLWRPTDDDLGAMAGWGYVELARGIYVDPDAPGLDPDRLLDAIEDHGGVPRAVTDPLDLAA